MTDSSRSCRPSTPAEFDTLVALAQECRRCLAMEGRRRVLSCLNGPVPARVMLVGEAPGRLGAERTGIPFHGDESGRRLDKLLAAAGWSRAEVFLTNAVLCNPTTASGSNRRPSAAELARCGVWLTAQIAVVDPRLIVTLGAVALEAVRQVAPHTLTLSDAGRLPVAWHGRWLACAYHPGARAAIHRPVALQRLDFEQLGRWLAAPARAMRPSELSEQEGNNTCRTE